MKRTATLLAGLLLVTGTVFAGEWTLTDADVEGTFNVINSQKGTGSNGGDLNLEVKAEKSGKYGTVGLVLQTDKDGDEDLRLTYSKTEGDWTVATEALLVDSDGTLLGATDNADGSENFSMNKGDGTYFKWNVMGSKTTTLTFYPYEVGGMSWDNDTWESFTTEHNSGGFVVGTKVGATDLNVRFASSAADEDNTKNQYTLKGDMATVVGTAKVAAAAGYSSGYKLKMVAAKVELPVAKFTVNAEVNYEDQASYTDAKFGTFVKGSYKLAEMNGYLPTAYASLETFTQKDSWTEIEAGLGLNKGSFTITPKVIINSADKDIYDKEDTATTGTEKSAFTAAVKFDFAL